MLHHSLRKGLAAGVLIAAVAGGTVAQAQTTQVQNQTQTQCNNTPPSTATDTAVVNIPGHGFNLALVGVAVPLDLQANCLVNVLGGPSQGQVADQWATSGDDDEATSQTQTQNQSQCNNTGGGSQSGSVTLGSALASVGAAVPAAVQANCLVNVLGGPSQGQLAEQSATP